MSNVIRLIDEQRNYTNSTEDVQIVAPDGGATITNDASGATITGGAGDDSIYNYYNNANVSIDGGDGSDTIENSYSSDVTITGGTGNDSIYNSGANVSIDGGEGNDTIESNGDDVTIDGGTGDDSIELNSYAKNNLIIHTGGNDTISGFGADDTLKLGDGTATYSVKREDYEIIITAGEDTITLEDPDLSVINIEGTEVGNYKSITLGEETYSYTNYFDDATIQASGKHGITNNGKRVSISAGTDDDYIVNYNADNVSINGGAGNDRIENKYVSSIVVSGANVSINGGAGSDTITNSGASATLLGGDGDDYISNTGLNVVIDGGAGNDSINNDVNWFTGDATINGGDGSDTITNNGERVIINGGAGDDLISLSAYAQNNVIEYNAGDGFDQIRGFDENDTLKLGAEYSSVMSGDDLILTVGKGKVTLKSVAGLSAINIDGTEKKISSATLTEGDDYYDNTLDGATLAALGGNDTVFGSGANVLIDGGAGDDSISVEQGNNTLAGGAGNNTLTSGAGKDIFLYDGAKGGNDVIVDYKFGDVIALTNASFVSSELTNPTLISSDSRDNDRIISVETSDGLRSITVKNAAYKNIVLTDGDGEIVTVINAATLISDYKTLYLTDEDDNQIELGSDKTTLDASRVTHDITVHAYTGEKTDIWGGSGNDYIVANKDSSDYINGGAGNDTLVANGGYNYFRGGAGNDYFVHDESSWSRDEIFDYEEGDRIVIGYDQAVNEDYSYCGDDNKDVKISFGIARAPTENITLIGAAGKTITVIYPDGEIAAVFTSDGEKVTENVTFDIETLPPYYLDTTPVAHDIENAINSTLRVGSSLNDTINNSGVNATIFAGDGDDSIYNGGELALIGAGEGSDTVSNREAKNVTINAGAGNDSVQNMDFSENVSMNGGAGNDILINQYRYIKTKGSENVTLNGGDGSDTISNFGEEALLLGGEGNDSITNSGDYSTIDGGEGSDTISNSGRNVLFKYTGGNDSIVGFNDTSTLQIMQGTLDPSLRTDGSNLFLSIGEEVVTISNAASLDNINIVDADGNKIAVDIQKDISVPASGEYFTNLVNNATVYGTAGNDSIQNYGASVSINGYGGNDYIHNYWKSDYSTIDGGEGNDSIYNSGYYSAVDGGAGNDSIEISGNDVTINAGEGDDYISNLYGDRLLINYALGDGNDLIQGFKANSTLSITGAKFSSSVSGDDVIVTVGDGKITLKGAANLNERNIFSDVAGEWSYADGKAVYGMDEEILITVTGVKSADGLELNGNVVTVHASALDNANVTISDGYTLALADDVGDIEAGDPTWEVSGTTATYKQTTSAGYELSDDAKTITCTEETSETLATITGLKRDCDAANITVDGNVITLSADALGTTDIKVTGDYTLALADDVGDIEAGDPTWEVSGTTATYKQTTSAGYELSEDAKTITYSADTGDALIELTGLRSGLTANDIIDGVEIDDKTITVSKSLLGTSDVTVSDGYKLKLGVDVPEVEAGEPVWSVSKTTATLKATTTSGYELSDDAKSINYIKAATGSTLATITNLNSGLKVVDGSIAGINIKDKTVSLSKDVLGTAKVAISGDYKLALDLDVPEPETDTAWTFDSKKFIATLKGNTTAGYTLAANEKSITYAAAKTGSTFATVSGVKNVAGLYADDDDKIITVSKDSLNAKNITLTDSAKLGYKLAIDPEIDEPEESDAAWSYDSKGKAYNLKGDTTAGYTLTDEKTITYTAKATGKVLATVKGLKANLNIDGGNDGVDFNGETITVKESALNKAAVTLTTTGNYKLALDADVPEVETGTPSWSVSNTTGTLKATTTAGYTLASDKSITYTAAKTGATLATVTGLKSGAAASGVEIDPDLQVIKLKAATLATTKVAIKNVGDNDYTLELDDAITEQDPTRKWNVSNTTVTFDETKPAYYTLADDGLSVTYTAAKTTNLAKLTNLKKNLTKDADGNVNGLDFNGETITISAAALNNATVALTGSGNYKLALDDDVTKSEVGESKWSYVAKTKTYNLTQTIPKGYSLSDNADKINYASKDTPSTLATVSGLKTNLTITDGEVDGMTVNGNVITLTEDALNNATVKVTGNYELALADQSLTEHAKKNIWAVSKTTATYKLGTPAYYTPASNGKSITYKAAAQDKGSAIITLSGLKSGIVPDKDGSIDGIIVDETNKTVTVSEGVLAVTNNGKLIVSAGYTLKLDDINEPEETFEWKLTPVLDKKKNITSYTATLNKIKSAGYTLTNDRTLTYTAKTTTAQAVITGLSKELALNEDGTIDGLDYDTDKKIITVAPDALTTAQVKLTGNGGYKLELDGEVETVTVEDTAWSYNKSKKYYELKGDASAGYVLAADGKSISCLAKKDNTVLATVSGVKSADGLAFDESDNTIVVSADSLGTAKVTTAGNYQYKLALDDDVIRPTTNQNLWTLNKTTATLYNGTTKGYTLGGDGKSITYSGAKATTKALATITGLRSGLAAKTLETSLDGFAIDDDNKITLSDNVLTITNNGKVTLTDNAKAGYKLALDTDVNTEDNATNVWKADTKTKTTYTYREGTEAHYTLNSNTVTYTAAKQTGSTDIVKLTGLKSGLAVGKDGEISGITVGEDSVTLANNVLNKTTVKVTGDYSLVRGDDVTKADAQTPYWTFDKNKSTATLKQTTPAGYKLDANGNIVYVSKAATATLATVTGLANTLKVVDGTIDGLAFDESKQVITVSANALTENVKTKVAVTSGKGYSYTLALDSESDNKVQQTADDTDVWAVSGTTATRKNGTTGFYTLVNDKNGKPTSITYTAAKQTDDAEEIIKLTGLKSGLAVDKFGEISGITVGEDQTVTLDNKVLNKTAVTLTGDYKLVRGEGVPVTDSEAPTWTYSTVKINKVNVPTQTLKQYTPAIGYALSKDEKSLTYFSKAKTTTTLATINGVVSGSNFNDTDSAKDHYDDYSKVVNVTDSDLSKKVTVSGSYSFDFSDYGEALITGSAGSDTLNIAGEKISVNSAAGNDIITVNGEDVVINAGAGNNYIASTGDGSKLTGGTGVDYITNTQGDNVTISAGDGNNVITSTGGSVSITSGKNNDIITVTGDNASINAGAGNNSITAASTGDGAKITVGAGNDTINVTGANSVINASNGTNRITSTGNGSKLTGGTGVDYITNIEGDNVTIAAGDGNNVISSTGGSVNITSGKNNDRVEVNGLSVTVNTAAGNDTIDLTGDSDNSSINAGAGNDLVTVGGGSNVTVSAGAGNDTIWGDAGTDTTFIYSGGKDIIYGFGDDDTLTLSGITFKESWGSYKNGNVVITVDKNNTITLNAIAADATLNISGKEYGISGSKLVAK